MTSIDEQKNNPLHGVSLDQLLAEIVSFYGFEILAEYTRINCFKNRPSIASSLKFLKKTEWAREKIERFYLYTYKNLPKADESEFDIPPRKRLIPLHHKPKAPQKLVLGQAPAPKPRTAKSFSKTPRSDKGPRKTQQNDSSDKQSLDPYANAPR
ncbi:VF530 family protein [Thalassotalea ganghwensis]